MNAKILCVLLLVLLLFSSCARKSVSTADSVPSHEPPRGDNYKIGVILPLTGKYAIYGASTLNGIECAVGIFAPCEGLINAELVIKDDAGLPDRAVLAVEDLANNDKVSVIIGPLSSTSIEAAAERAQSLSIPLISLSQREEIPEARDYVFSVALTAASQVNEIVNYAVQTKKLKNLAVVYPTSVYGEMYKNLFIDAALKAHAKVVFSERYGETTLDFGGLFRSGKKFDALFIPDSYRAVGFIASAMIAEGIEGVQLLGINRWNNPELVERGGDSLEGSVFVDGFFESSDRPVQKFISAFKEAYKVGPTILEAQGFDAARLASKAIQSTGGRHTTDVRNALAIIPDVEGASGDIGFDSNRKVIRRPFLLTVKDGNIVELGGHVSQKTKDKYGTPIEQKDPSVKY